jgi:hypothetical protein
MLIDLCGKNSQSISNRRAQLISLKKDKFFCGMAKLRKVGLLRCCF